MAVSLLLFPRTFQLLYSLQRTAKTLLLHSRDRKEKKTFSALYQIMIDRNSLKHLTCTQTFYETLGSAMLACHVFIVLS